MKRIVQHIESWLSDRGNNAIEPGSELAAFDAPLVGFATGDDPLFSFIKEDISSDSYWSPADAFSLAFPGERFQADELTVIAWILPQTEHTRQAHKKAEGLPSIEWSRARHYGEKVNENLRNYLVQLFATEGIQACAPTLLPQWCRFNSLQYGFASCWSERHTAHVCGLGTFGLSDGLITPVGKAVRVGSIIARKNYSPSPRKYQTHNEWCLFQATGKCLACARRCPAGAISTSGHDKVKCKAYIRNITAEHVAKEQLGFKVNSCGLCQTKVPCESRNPVAGKKS